MSDTLFDMTPYKSEAARSYTPDWIDATGLDPSWDVLESALDLETSTDSETTNTPTGWRSAAEFTITLKSGLSIDVKFVPGIQGELSMHQFDFTGPISPTGFKSHFVLAVESEPGWATPADYAQAYAQGLVAQLKSKKHSSLNKKRPRSVATAQAPQELTADNDNSTLGPTMAENETTDSSHTPVEVVEELSPDEAADRQQLELKVERGIEQVEQTFYQMGKALGELRDRRLYRSTHNNFSNYCQERFHPMTRRKAEYLIVAAAVMDELKSANNCSHFPLPTAESQIRCLRSLQPEQWQEVWQTGVSESGGKVPTARTIKGIVERLKERDTTPPPIPYHQGDVVLIRGLGNPDLRKYDGHWAIAIAINEYSVTVALNGKDIPVKPQFLEEVDPKYWAEIKAVNERITILQQYELDPMESAGLEVLRRLTCFTSKQITLLERMEKDYGIV